MKTEICSAPLPRCSPRFLRHREIYRTMRRDLAHRGPIHFALREASNSLPGNGLKLQPKGS